MCELFGISAREKVNITKRLKTFFSHAPNHPNGWGLYLSRGQTSFFHKEMLRADKSAYLRNFCSRQIVTKNAVGHIRLATIGHVEEENTHPFRGFDLSGREWIFAHNGTIFEADCLKKYLYVQDGETDSERIFLHLLDRMNERIRARCGPLEEAERFDVLEEIVEELSPHNKLNLLIYDEEILYAHTNLKESLYEGPFENGICISTTKLDEKPWEPVPFMRLCAYRDGKRIRTGKECGSEYIPDPADLNALYLAYAAL